MYLKTPKRYTPRGRRVHLINWRWAWLWLITPLIAVVGWRIYQSRAALSPVVGQYIEDWAAEGQMLMATAMAPTPRPTENPQLLIQRADDNWKAGRIEDAVEEYTEAAHLAPNDLRVHYNLTMGLLMEGLTTQAIAAAEDTITASPFSSDAWSIRGLALVRDGQFGRGIASLLYALELDPQNPRPLAFLSEAYLGANLPDRARLLADQALELDPNSAEAYYARAQVRRLADFDLPAARDDLENAFTLAPHMTDAAVDLAYIDYNQGDYDAGIEVLTRLIESNPDNTNALFALGFIYNSGIGNPTRAGDYLARCIDVDGLNIGCHYYYGLVQIRLEQYQLAADNLARAVQLGTEREIPNARHHYWAGEAQIYLGNCPLALNYLRPGLEIAVADGTDPDLINALQNSVRECQAFDNSPFAPTLPPEEAPEGDVTSTPNA